MRPSARSILVLLALLGASPTLGATSTAVKKAEHRMEADEVVAQVIRGGTVAAALSRLHYLREEDYAAAEISEQMRRVVDERARRNLAALLSGLGSRVGERALVQLLADADGSVRMSAAQGLARVRSRVVEPVLPLLQDKSSGVRREAARALGASGNVKMGRVLVAAAKDETDLEVRAAMLASVGETGDKKQIPALKAYLDSGSEGTRFAAARGLCRLDAPEGVAFAGRLLASSDKFVRRQGLELYEGVSAKKSARALQPLLEDKERALAAAAARILYQGGDASMLEWLVLASWNAKGTDKLDYEKELETLQLADDQRKAILRKAGVAK
ncbi:HEAT repeat domain-containing protein [Corallococcus sp. H22C18031201]|nr:HEAT repeat domain-containing protein [Corallococcus sp. H22C18031201]